jgi:hypothetical protein
MSLEPQNTQILPIFFKTKVMRKINMKSSSTIVQQPTQQRIQWLCYAAFFCHWIISSLLWFAHSPDLPSCHYCLWQSLTDKFVYQNNPHTKVKININMVHAVLSISWLRRSDFQVCVHEMLNMPDSWRRSFPAPVVHIQWVITNNL